MTGNTGTDYTIEGNVATALRKLANKSIDAMKYQYAQRHHCTLYTPTNLGFSFSGGWAA